jgi:hypothetical protein
LADGGVIPRHGYQTAGTVSDLPVDAEIVERAPGLDPNVVSDLKREEQRQSAIPQEAKGLAVDPTLIRSESGGNWQAENKALGHGGMYGHFGRAQFGHARLQDAMNAGIIPEGTTPQQFKDNQKLQEKTEAWHFGDISNFIADKGYDRLIGTKINGIPVTEQGMINAAHLGGKGGLQKYLESNGQINPNDGRKSLSDYMAMGAGMTGFDRSGQGLGAARPTGEASAGSKEPGFFDGIGMNKQTILPLLQGLGAMAGSKSRYLGSAILEGLGAGAKAYGDVEAQQAGIKQTEAGTTGTQAQTQAVLAAISKGAGIPRADGTIAAYRVYINGRPTTVSSAEFIRALQAGTPYETTPPMGAIGGVSKGAPEVSADASSILPPQIPADQNKVHAIQPGVIIDEQAIANARRDSGSPTMSLEQSKKIKSDIDNAATAAANNRSTIGELAGNTSNLIAQGIGGTGSLADARSQVLNVGNTIYKLATGNSLPEGYDGSDLQINRKIASYLAGLQTSSVNQNNANAFVAALEGTPNATLSPKALASITSLIMIQNDRPQGIQKFANTYGEASAGNFSGNVVSNYDRIHGRQQQAEQHNLADLFIKAPKAAAKIANGEIPYDAASERLKQLYPKTPDLIRHLQNR